MINNNIQELFDGTLGDEQSAELLHLLSVNPERRADFRRYIALQEAMRRDRAMSALNSDEDTEIWGVLAGLGGAVATTTTGSNVLNWIARAAAVVVVGIAGYLLGSNSSTNIFADGSAGNGTVATATRENTPATGMPSASRPIGSAGTVIRHDAAANAAASATTTSGTTASSATISAAAQEPRVIYRDRIVYKYAPARDHATAIASNDGATNSTRSPIQSPVDPSARNGDGANNNGANGTPLTQQHDGSGSASNANATAPATIPPATAPATETKEPKAEAKGSDTKVLDPNSVLGHQALRSGSEGPEEPAVDPVAASILRNGFEVGLSDHEGLISPAPAGEESDPSFSNRNIDLSYRILDGRFGVGARFGYGSFAMVSLGSTLRARSNAKGELASVETVLYPVLQPQKQFLTEFFLNYRLPVGGRFALGLESSLGVSARHTKAGGDASLLWFFGEHVGMHAGAGLGYYWYDLTSANEEAIRNSPDNTSVVEMSDSYHGTVVEFKYGLFYHF
jgi:hypothetical protein